MMITLIDELLQNVQDVQENINDIVLDSVDGSLVVDLNRNQMEAGQTGLGLDIVPKYAPFTIQEKRRKGQISTRVTLKDTGDFRKSIKAVKGNDNVELIATDSKVGKLKKKYTDDILGLNNSSMSAVIDDTKLKVKSEILKQIMK